jgi:hypothetical protein
MNDKAQMTVAVIIAGAVALVAAMIGLAVINGTTYGQCNAYSHACAGGNITNTTYTNLGHAPLEYNSQVVYNTTGCTGTPLVNGTNYTVNVTGGGIMLLSNTLMTGNKSWTFDYFTTEYLGGGTTCTVVNNWPLLFAVGGLVLAGAWLYLR